MNVSGVSELIDALASLDCGSETIIEMNPATSLYVLTDIYDSSFFGDNGLPIIYCNVTINGNGTTLTRSNSAPPFRLFGVDSGGSLTINDLALTNGKPSETGGGTILSVGGAVSVNRSYVLNNVIDFETGWQTLGAGIYVYYGSLSITDSEIAGNQNLAGNASENLGDGGGVASINGTVTLSGVNFHDNAVSRDGSAAAILDNSTVDAHINVSCIVGNAGLSVYANWGLDATSNWWGDANGPLVDQPSTGTRDSINSTVTAISPLNARPDCGVPPPVCGSFAPNSLAAQDNCPTSTPTPTPMPTSTPFGCHVTFITPSQFQTYITNAPDQVRELQDMRVLVDSTGMNVLLGPIINAKHFGAVINWGGASYIVSARVEFPQGDSDKQIWYRIASSDAWIPVRYDGLDYSNTYDPCSSVAAPVNLTFAYDRKAAANYAIEHSYDTLVNFANLSSSGRVTQKLNAANLPYAHFHYDDVGNGQGTGSAIFVSEAIWMGGLPMTYGIPESCTSTTNQSDKGWRYCFGLTTSPTGDYASAPFDTHEDLFAYWATGYQNAVLIGNRGSQLLFPGLPISQNIQYIWGGDTLETTNHDLSLYNGSQVMGNLFFGVVSDPQGLSNRVQQLLTDNSQNRIIQMVDYIYINTVPSHGLIIVGWQEALNCIQAFEHQPNWLIDDFGVSFQDAQAKQIPNPVPYVADFTDPASTQRTTPRPFYCTRFNEDYDAAYFNLHNWYFFTLPDSVSLPNPMLSPTAPNRIYIDPRWQW